MLDMNKTVFETLDDVAVGDMRLKVKALLGAFLFRGDDIDKKVKVLSGGEKARLSLAKMLLFPTNLLVLDEPTNHLDMLSKDILKNALIQYDGTLIIVSHDRDFLQGLTNKVYEFRKPSIKEYIGDIYDFLEQKNLNHLKELEIAAKQPKAQEVATQSQNKINYEHKKQVDAKLRKVDKEIQRLEEILPAYCDPPVKLEGEKYVDEDGYGALISWGERPEPIEEWLHYDDGEYLNRVGNNGEPYGKRVVQVIFPTR